MLQPQPNHVLRAAAVAGFILFGLATGASAAGEWLSLCSKCINPSVFSQSGIDSANAVAEARITRAEVQGWCANWQPDDKNCVKQELANQDLKKVYRASANCPAGRFTPIDGKTYRLAGSWDNSDIGGGRSKWRDASGKIVGRDNASGGLAISQQWEVLCPGSGSRAKGSSAAPTAAAETSRAAANARPPAPAARFAVGQVVMARYGRDWVRARIHRIRQTSGPSGPENAYDISLDNGKRGIVPERMLRAQ